MNKVILLGRLTKDPEIRYSQGAEPVCIARFTLAVNRRFKKEGEPDADFINCTAFRRTAEFMERYMKKGMMASVCGSLRITTSDDPTTGQRKWFTDVNCDEVDFAESRAAYEARMAREGSGYDASANTTPPSGFGSSPSGFGSAPSSAYNLAPTQDAGFQAITQSIDEDDDLPF